MKKIIAAVLAGMFLVSVGAFAADRTCDNGMHTDETTHHCVKDTG